jgi:hypothetical protein
MRAPVTTAIALFLLALPLVAQDSTASLTGKVTGITSAGVDGTVAELESERAPIRRFRAVADAAGEYRFAGLPAGDYDLKLSGLGFFPLNVKAIHILDSEQRSMPPVQLPEGLVDCRIGLDYLLPSGDKRGSLRGTVRLARVGMPISGAAVTLICDTGKTCGKTRADSGGEFVFETLPRGDFSLLVKSPGFYHGFAPHFGVMDGFESVYSSMYLDRCPLGNCRKKRLVICQ